jgi:hypothetical protein
MAQDEKEALSHIPKTGKTIASFIPKGYDTITVAKGDLNKDSKEDIVLVLHDKREDTADPGSEINENHRPLVVLLKTDDGWKVGAKSVNVIMCKGCGGVYGDPFNQITITNGVITIDQYGGSNWRWGYTYKFRYQEGEFYLIGLTKDSYSVFGGKGCEEIGSANRDFEDINFVTGQRERLQTSEDCKELLNKTDKIKKKPLVKLADYKYDN